ncbi:MAG: UDP-N-acetylmuramate--L-alanine ligase [Ilumatobacteraceae bacterium]
MTSPVPPLAAAPAHRTPVIEAALATLAARPVAAAPQPEPPLQLALQHRLHVVGVGGPGMSAVAIALAEMGHVVSGSDLREHPVLERVRAANVDVHIGHDRGLVRNVDAVTASTAIPERNIELAEARETGVTVLTRAGMLASICARAKSLAVAGTHGKTTTTSMLMLILAEAGMRPGFVVGGDVTDVGTGAHWANSDWLVVEADESDGTHLELPLHGTILTNVESDHLDHYGSFDGIVEGFDTYLAQIAGPKVICGDDPIGRALAERHGGTSYGFADTNDIQAVDVEPTSGSFTFTLVRRADDGSSERLGEIALPLRGLHNVSNATGAAAMALAVGVAFDDVASALAKFGGVARRFDIRGTDGGATFVDDYAHLPSEINAVLLGARSSGDDWRRVVAVFQPNRYHRIADMWEEYGDAFVEADLVVLTDIYASGTVPIPGVTGKLIVNAVTEADPERRVVWLPKREDLVGFLAGEVRDGDVCISMGCGDIATLPAEVLDARGH